ncbi:Hpt domain-containing protein [Rhodopseudomonas sp. P2A-2r]|uniref:Hpt domain-containing protein n=1 Tax=unclassified Rhodopseudomonas TaxID=2638247 RepID=UPI00223454E8|nr:Hpt domain-containing protein [Rhodopseudomonas sp. P2A-2r]UZE49322.1 Hpt domain-containing protein [Rhodopseudomonas sp. P2A-2r]
MPLRYKSQIDRTAFERLAAEIEVEGALETFAVFQTDTQRRLLALETIGLEAHRGEIQTDAHSLKSTAATFGFTQLATLAASLEKSAPTIQDPDFRAMVIELGSAFATGLAQFDAAFRQAIPQHAVPCP